MTDTLTLPFAPPPYSLNYNGSTFWPPECRLIEDEWPFVAEAWEKWENDYERIAHRNWQQKIRCKGLRLAERRGRGTVWRDGHYWAECGEVFEGTDAWRRHCLAEHPGRQVDGAWANTRWVWEMLGFADVWDGRPVGWYTLIDGREPQRGDWELAVIEVGTRVADQRKDGVK